MCPKCTHCRSAEANSVIFAAVTDTLVKRRCVELSALRTPRPNQSRRAAWARMEGYWLCRRASVASLRAVGRHFGCTEHSAVIHGCRAIDKRIAASPVYAREITGLLLGLKSRTDSAIGEENGHATHRIEG